MTRSLKPPRNLKREGQRQDAYDRSLLAVTNLMIDETQEAQAVPTNDAPDAPSPASHSLEPRSLDPRFPTEPFPCPNCGQMLGSDVRVCVACRKPIDPSQIKTAVAAAAEQAPGFAPPAQAQVRFPWGVFVVFLVLGSLMTSEGATALGPLRALLVIGAIQVMSSIWVFYDAHQKGIPKPLYWGIGALFFWLPIFSWYLVRRRQPDSACPLIEAGAGQFLRTLLLIFAVTMFLTVLLSLLLGSARGPSPKPNLTQPAGHQGGSIANRWLGSPYSPVSVEPTSTRPVSDGPGFVAKNAVRRESYSDLEFESGA